MVSTNKKDLSIALKGNRPDIFKEENLVKSSAYPENNRDEQSSAHFGNAQVIQNLSSTVTTHKGSELFTASECNNVHARTGDT